MSDPARRGRRLRGGLRVAALLAWISALVMGLASLGFGAEALAQHGWLSLPLATGVLALLLAASAWCLGRRRRANRWLAVATIGTVIVLLIPVAVGPYLLLNIVILGLVLAAWREFS